MKNIENIYATCDIFILKNSIMVWKRRKTNYQTSVCGRMGLFKELDRSQYGIVRSRIGLGEKQESAGSNFPLQETRTETFFIRNQVNG